MSKLNPLNIRSKKEALLANSILFSPSFIKGRGATKEGRSLYNKETDMVAKAFKKFGYKQTKKAKNSKNV